MAKLEWARGAVRAEALSCRAGTRGCWHVRRGCFIDVSLLVKASVARASLSSGTRGRGLLAGTGCTRWVSWSQRMRVRRDAYDRQGTRGEQRLGGARGDVTGKPLASGPGRRAQVAVESNGERSKVISFCAVRLPCADKHRHGGAGPSLALSLDKPGGAWRIAVSAPLSSICPVTPPPQ